MGSGEGERHRGAASELIPAVQTRGGHCAHGAATRTQARGISQPGRFPYASPLQIIPARRSRDYTRSAVLPAYPRPHSLRTLGTCQSNTRCAPRHRGCPKRWGMVRVRPPRCSDTGVRVGWETPQCSSAQTPRSPQCAGWARSRVPSGLPSTG